MPIKRDKEGVIIEITLTDDEEEELDEEAAAKKKKEEEDKLKELKEKEAFMEMIHVMIAFVIIMTMAVGTVALKLYMFPEEKIEGFQPLPQKVNSIIKYTANGYLPCGGRVPTPLDCNYPPYEARVIEE